MFPLIHFSIKYIAAADTETYFSTRKSFSATTSVIDIHTKNLFNDNIINFAVIEVIFKKRRKKGKSFVTFAGTLISDMIALAVLSVSSETQV